MAVSGGRLMFPGRSQHHQPLQPWNPQPFHHHPLDPHYHPQLGQPLSLHPQLLGRPLHQHQQLLGQPHQQFRLPGQQQQLGQLQSFQQHQHLGQPLQQQQQFGRQQPQSFHQHPGHPRQQHLGQPPSLQQHSGDPHPEQRLQQQSVYPGQRQQQQQPQSEHPRQQQQQSGSPGQPYSPINPTPNGYTHPVTKMAQLSPTLPQNFIYHLQPLLFSTLPPLPSLPPPLPPLPPSLPPPPSPPQPPSPPPPPPPPPPPSPPPSPPPPPPQQSPSLHSPNPNPPQFISPGQTHQPPTYPGQPYHQLPGDAGQQQQSVFLEKPHQRQHSGYTGQQAYMSMNSKNEYTPPATEVMPPMGIVCYSSPPLSRPACIPNSGLGGEASVSPPLPWPQVTSPISRPLAFADITSIEISQRTVEKSHPQSGSKAGMAAPFLSPPLLIRPPVSSPIVRPLGSPDITAVKKLKMTLYVGKIAPSVGNDFIHSLLELCGPIKRWKRAQDPSDGAPKRFGFCEFESAEGVLRALRLLSKRNVDGEELVLNVNKPTRKYLERYAAKKKEDLSKQSESGVEEAKAENGENVKKKESGKPAKVAPKKDVRATENKENDRINFGLITDDDRLADREASEKLTKLIEEHIKNKHLCPPPPPFQGVADGSGNLYTEMRSKSEDKLSDIDTVNNDEKSGNERTREIKSARRAGSVSPYWKGSGNRWRVWERNRDRQEKERPERVSYRFERELQQCRANREYEIQKAERLNQKRLEELEFIERENEYTWMYDEEVVKKRRRESMQLTADQEDECDDDYRKRRRKYAIEEKRRRRQRVKEEGLTDKIKEDDEITEAGKRDDEEQGGHEEEQELGQREKEEALTDKMKEDGEITDAGERDDEEQESQREERNLWRSVNEEGLTDKIKEDGEMTKAKKRDKEVKESPEEGKEPEPSSVPVANEGETPLLSETESGEIIDKMEVHQSHLADPASECQTGDDMLENVKTDEPATASDIRSDSASDLKVSANTVAEKLELGMMLSEKRTTVLSVFQEEDEENTQSDKMRPLVHTDYSIEETQATQKNDGQVPAAAAESSKHISPKDVKFSVEKERSKCSHDRSIVRECERDDDHPRAPRILDVKQLIDMVPKTKDELVSYEINWAIYDEYCLYERMRPWISKTITEFLGGEEESLVEFIADKFRQHVKAEKMMELLQQILDEEAEMFVLRMWKMLIFEIKRAEIVVMLRKGI